MKKLFGASLILLCIGLVSVAQGSSTVSTAFEMPVNIQTSMSTSGCSNSPGPTITLQGALSLGGMGVKLLFENNVKGTHTYTVESTASATVIPQGQSIQIPKQPVFGGVGGNPYIWLQFMDSHDNPLSGTTFLGRCVQGLFTTSADFTIPSTAMAQGEHTVYNCQRSPHPSRPDNLVRKATISRRCRRKPMDIPPVH